MILMYCGCCDTEHRKGVTVKVTHNSTQPPQSFQHQHRRNSSVGPREMYKLYKNQGGAHPACIQHYSTFHDVLTKQTLAFICTLEFCAVIIF